VFDACVRDRRVFDPFRTPEAVPSATRCEAVIINSSIPP
jgi:hypothetical protein